MSLINEALRKARQAASEHESKQPAGPFQPARAYPSRRSGRRGGLLTMAIIAVAAGVIGAMAAWWILGNHERPSSEAINNQSKLVEATPPASSAPGALSPSDDQTEPVVLTEPTAAPATPVVVPASEQNIAEHESPVAAAVEPIIGSNGERIFVMEAELGYASLSLGYIVARSSNAFAEINGTEVWIDSEIEGFVVEAIEADRVVLRDDKGPLILRVP